MSTGRGQTGLLRLRAAADKVVEPFGVLFANRSLTWLVAAFSGFTVAEWGYVTALAVDAYRLHGSIAVGLVEFRLFFAAVGSLGAGGEEIGRAHV